MGFWKNENMRRQESKKIRRRKDEMRKWENEIERLQYVKKRIVKLKCDKITMIRRF